MSDWDDRREDCQDAREQWNDQRDDHASRRDLKKAYRQYRRECGLDTKRHQGGSVLLLPRYNVKIFVLPGGYYDLGGRHYDRRGLLNHLDPTARKELLELMKEHKDWQAEALELQRQLIELQRGQGGGSAFTSETPFLERSPQHTPLVAPSLQNTCYPGQSDCPQR